MIKTKGFRLTIYILLAVLLISCFSTIAIVLNKDKSISKSDNPKAADLTISNLEELKAFMKGSQQGNDSYAGKTIVLDNDIYCEGADVSFGWEDLLGGDVADSNNCSFKGTFDGQGHTIYNVVRELGFMNTGENAGLFVRNAGTIKNLRVKGFYYYIGFDSADYTGCLVGKNTGTIENCIVENFSCKSNRDDGDLAVRCGPIAGYNSGTIKNCMVNGTYRIGGEDDGGVQEGVWAAYFVARNAGAINSIFTANVVKDWLTEDTHAPSEWDSAELSDDFSSCSSAYNSMTSDISTTCGESGTAWFKYKTLSHGYGDSPYYNSGGTIYYYNVYLRAFVDFTTYYFNSADTSMGTVSTSSITVPNDYASISDSETSKKTGYGDYCNPKPTSVQYSFSHWTSSGNSYTAHFTGRISNIFFCNYDDNIIVQTTNLALDTWYNLAYGANLKITYDKFSKSSQQYTYEEYEWNGYYEELVEKIGTAYCLKALTFEFTDPSGVYRKITYKPKNNTQCIGVPTTGLKAWGGTVTYKEGNNPYNVTYNELFDEPMLLNKEYNITFG